MIWGGIGGRTSFRGDVLGDILSLIRQEVERKFENMEKTIPKDFVREYDTSEHRKVRTISIRLASWQYSTTVGPVGRPK